MISGNNGSSAPQPSGEPVFWKVLALCDRFSPVASNILVLFGEGEKIPKVFYIVLEKYFIVRPPASLLHQSLIIVRAPLPKNVVGGSRTHKTVVLQRV